MNAPKTIGILALGGAASLGAASENVPLNYFTIVVTVMGGTYTILKTVRLAVDWAGARRRAMVKEVAAEVLAEVHDAIKTQAEESARLHKALRKLPCVRTGGAICDPVGEEFSSPRMSP